MSSKAFQHFFPQKSASIPPRTSLKVCEKLGDMHFLFCRINYTKVPGYGTTWTQSYTPALYAALGVHVTDANIPEGMELVSGAKTLDSALGRKC